MKKPNKNSNFDGIELVPPRLSWVSLAAELQTHTSGASGIYFVSSMNCGFIFQPFAIFNTADAINENASFLSLLKFSMPPVP